MISQANRENIIYHLKLCLVGFFWCVPLPMVLYFLGSLDLFPHPLQAAICFGIAGRLNGTT